MDRHPFVMIRSGFIAARAVGFVGPNHGRGVEAMGLEQFVCGFDDEPVRRAVVHVALVGVWQGDERRPVLRDELLCDVNYRIARVGQVGLQDVFIGRVVHSQVNRKERVGRIPVFEPNVL